MRDIKRVELREIAKRKQKKIFEVRPPSSTSPPSLREGFPLSPLRNSTKETTSTQRGGHKVKT